MTKPRSLIILATCCLSLLLVTMDITIVNVALPAIRSGLGASAEALAWSIDGYTVVVASFLMLAGSMGDRFGRRRTFQLGLAVFSLGSLACSLAPSAAALVAARVLQAVGGSMLNPVAMSILANTFTETKERARAIGVWGAVFGVSMAAGPLVGGALVDRFGWRSIFWINIPIAVIAIALTARFVPESRAPEPRRLDLVAQALVIVGLVALTTTVIEGRGVGWSSWTVVAGFGAALFSAVLLVLWESRRSEPLLDPRLFRSVPFASATLLAVLSFSAFAGFLFLNSLYLQEARGLSASAAGLMTLPIALALLVSSPLSGRLVAAGRTRAAIVISGIAVVSSGLLLTRLADDTPTLALVAAYALFGVGIGTIGAPVNTTALAGLPRSQAGVAAAIASTSRQVGSALGVAVAGALAGSGIEGGRHATLAASSHPVFWLVAVQGAAIVALGLASTGARARRSSERVGLLLGASAPASKPEPT